MRSFIRKSTAFCLVLCFVLLFGVVQAGAEICLDGNQNITVNLTGCISGEWYSLLVLEEAAELSSLTNDEILYASQMQANAEGCISVTFIHASLPKCVFLAGGIFAGGAASPRTAGIYTPDVSASELPAALSVIEEEAFMGSSFEAVIIGDQVSSIGDRAFKDCATLARIVIPENVTEIAADAFEGCGPITVVCSENSAAYTFAQAHDMTIELIAD